MDLKRRRNCIAAGEPLALQRPLRWGRRTTQGQSFGKEGRSKETHQRPAGPASDGKPVAVWIGLRQKAQPIPSSRVVRSRGLEPPRVAPLAPQASASTNSATTACGSERRPNGSASRDGAHVTNRFGPVQGRPFRRAARAATDQRTSGARGSSSLTSTAIRLPLHHHGALGDREVVGQDLHLVVLGGVELDDGAAAEPQRPDGPACRWCRARP